MATDHSAGLNAVADWFIAQRSKRGAELVQSWAKDFRLFSKILRIIP